MSTRHVKNGMTAATSGDDVLLRERDARVGRIVAALRGNKTKRSNLEREIPRIDDASRLKKQGVADKIAGLDSSDAALIEELVQLQPDHELITEYVSQQQAPKEPKPDKSKATEDAIKTDNEQPIPTVDCEEKVKAATKELEDKLGDATQKLSDAEVANDTLRQTVSSHKATISSLQRENTELQERINELVGKAQPLSAMQQASTVEAERQKKESWRQRTIRHWNGSSPLRKFLAVLCAVAGVIIGIVVAVWLDKLVGYFTNNQYNGLMTVLTVIFAIALSLGLGSLFGFWVLKDKTAKVK